MPPRSAKKTTPKATKPVTRAPKSAQKAQDAPETAKVEEERSQDTPDVVKKVDEKAPEVATEVAKVEEKQPDPKPEDQLDENGSGRDDADGKEVYEDEYKGERLELDDNDPEYEHEEDVGVDFEGKDPENDDGQEEVEEYEEVEEDMMEEIEEEEEVDAEGAEDENAEEHAVDVEEEEEHHDVVQERRKRKEFEIFVGGLDKDATEEDLRKVFSEVGEVTEVRLMMNPQTKKNKGFAFLRFATIEQAKRAVAEMKNPVIKKKQCGVSPSQDNDTLFLGNINKAWTKEQLKEKLKNYGIDSIDDLTLIEDTNNKGMNRGFAFLEFSSRSEAMDAFRRLQRRDVTFGVDRAAKVAFADTFIEPDDEIMAQVKTIFVDGLPSSWDEDRLKENIMKYGAIEKIELARNMPSARRKDFGFITFDTHEAAVACAEGLNNAELGEGDSKVKVRARLSRPHQRGRGKRGPRGDFRVGRGASRGGRLSWTSRPPPRRLPALSSRPLSVRGPLSSSRGFKRPLSFRERRPIVSSADRARRLPPPERPYDRRPPAPVYPKGSSKWNYSRHNELPPRRVPVEHTSRVPVERRPAYREEYGSRGSGYDDVVPRTVSRAAPRRGYADDGFDRRVERAPASAYRVTRERDYVPLPGTKRSYSAIDDAPPRYADVNVRQSRARVDYGLGGAQYADTYDERPARAHAGYGNSRSSLTSQDSREYYSTSRHGMDYGSGSARTSDVGGAYSSSFGRSYLSRESDVGGSSYSSLYSGRNLGGSGYMGGGSSGSYY